MSGWWSTASIRVRLTVWYTAALSLMLIVYASATYLAVRHEFREGLEDQMRADAEHRAASVNPEEHLEQQLDEILIVLVLGVPTVARAADRP